MNLDPVDQFAEREQHAEHPCRRVFNPGQINGQNAALVAMDEIHQDTSVGTKVDSIAHRMATESHHGDVACVIDL
jgi:hypothetical protein